MLPEVSLPDETLWVKAFVYGAVTILCFYFQDLYDWKYWKKASELISSLLLAEGLTLIVLALVYFILPGVGLERDVLLMAIAFTFVVTFGLRMVYVTLRFAQYAGCLLYTSDAADDLLCVDLGGRRIIKKNNHSHTSFHVIPFPH